MEGDGRTQPVSFRSRYRGNYSLRWHAATLRPIAWRFETWIKFNTCIHILLYIFEVMFQPTFVKSYPRRENIQNITQSVRQQMGISSERRYKPSKMNLMAAGPYALRPCYGL